MIARCGERHRDGPFVQFNYHKIRRFDHVSQLAY